jgi:hypothetical protein
VQRLRRLGTPDLTYIRYRNCSSAHTPSDDGDEMEDMIGHDAWTRTYSSEFFTQWQRLLDAK